MRMLNLSKALFTFFVAVAPALAVYRFMPGTNLAMSMLLVSGAVFFRLNLGNNIILKDEYQLCVGVLVLTGVASIYMIAAGTEWFDTTLMLHNLWGIMVCFLPLVFVVGNLNVKLFVRIVYIVGILAAFVVIWQRVTLIRTGSFNNDVFLPWFDVQRNLDDMSVKRPSAFFSEPAHFTIFMLPIFYLSLLDKRYLLSAIFSFSILCSGSSTGFIMLPIILLYYLFGINGLNRFSRMFVAFVFIFVGYGLIILFYPQVIMENMEKLMVMQGGNDSSANLRLIGPLAHVRYMDDVQLFVGITLNQLDRILNPMGHFWGKQSGNYANSIIFMFISYGAIGLSLLLMYLWRKWKSTAGAKGFLLIFIGILCSDQTLFNMHFFYLATFALYADDIHSLCKLRLQNVLTKEVKETNTHFTTDS